MARLAHLSATCAALVAAVGWGATPAAAAVSRGLLQEMAPSGVLKRCSTSRGADGLAVCGERSAKVVPCLTRGNSKAVAVVERYSCDAGSTDGACPLPSPSSTIPVRPSPNPPYSQTPLPPAEFSTLVPAVLELPVMCTPKYSCPGESNCAIRLLARPPGACFCAARPPPVKRSQPASRCQSE